MLKGFIKEKLLHNCDFEKRLLIFFFSIFCAEILYFYNTIPYNSNNFVYVF